MKNKDKEQYDTTKFCRKRAAGGMDASTRWGRQRVHGRPTALYATTHHPDDGQRGEATTPSSWGDRFAQWGHGATARVPCACVVRSFSDGKTRDTRATSA